jgi:hypothetical protein
MKPNTKQEIAQLENRWAQKVETKRQEAIADDIRLRAKVREALLEDKFVVPCRCHTCLTGLLEMNDSSCSGFNAYNVLFWSALKQGV